MMNRLEEIFRASGERKDYFLGYTEYLHDLLRGLDHGAIEGAVDLFLEARRNHKKIFFAGNGGSAATASHFAQDLGEVGRKVNRRGFKTLSLTDNVSAISAIGNDYGYGEIFAVQMVDLFCKGDLLVAISASGNSPNVVNAVNFAREAGGKTIGLVGFDGGRLGELCDLVIHVNTAAGEYGPVEDIHLILDHMITSYLIAHLARKGRNR
jgi:D-sedoheptulose 7-phosphate isomerase